MADTFYKTEFLKEQFVRRGKTFFFIKYYQQKAMKQQCWCDVKHVYVLCYWS